MVRATSYSIQGIFLALFFLSIGLQMNIDFVAEHAALVVLIVVVILTVNSAINSFVFKLLNESWRNSIYAGALLSQIGEFSLVLCMVAKNQQMVSDFWYQLTLAVVSFAMLMTALWINIIRTLIYKQASHIRNTGEFIQRNIKKLSKSAN